MFLVSDTLEGRQKLIRAHAGQQATLGSLLSVIDFEWTLRRATIALGYLPTKDVRKDLERASGLRAYRKYWNKHVRPYRLKELVEIIPEYDFLRDKSFPLRHKIAHGAKMTATQSHAFECRDYALNASRALCEFSSSHGVDIYQRLPIRRIAKELEP